MAFLTLPVLPPATVDVPLNPAENTTVVTTSILPLPIITVVSVVPSLIAQAGDQGTGAGVVFAPLQAGVAVPIIFSGAWPQENFPNYSYKYVILPSTVVITVPTLEQVPEGATIVGYTADLTVSLINTWTITVSDGSVLPCTQVVENNWSRQQTKLASRINVNAP